MPFMFQDPRSDNHYEVSDSIKDFVDKHHSGFLMQYLYSLIHFKTVESNLGFAFVDKPGVEEIEGLIQQAFTGDTGLRSLLRLRRTALSEIPAGDLIDFENELGVDIRKLQKGEFASVFDSRNNDKIIAAFMYWDYFKISKLR